MMEIYNAGLYCRLSREDENSNGNRQSESIKNQADFLSLYVIEKGWNIFDIYADDGYSGTSFDRPDFKRLICDIEAGKVNLVLVKDLSRLGRDYIETGLYLEKFFPEKNIRFIAVNDGVDTFSENSNNDMSPFKSVINDMYAKDISKKVITVFRSKAAAGEFIGAFAPYGYKKDTADRNKLIIDNVVASVVKRIFKMYIEGIGLSQIAHTLNNEKIPNPATYKATNSNYVNSRIKNELWSHSTIKAILTNMTYTGNLAQGKYRKVSYKIKKLRVVDRRDWIVVENTHEPVISQEDFDLVQAMMYRKSSGLVLSKKTNKPLSGFVFCGDCGEYMTFTKTKKDIEYLICSKYKRYTSKYCTRHSVKVVDIEAAILVDINSIIKAVINIRSISEDISIDSFCNKGNEIEKEIRQLKKEIADIGSVIKSLYRDKVKGTISEEDFINLNKEFSKERDILVYRCKELNNIKQQEDKNRDGVNDLLKTIKNLTQPKKLTSELLERLIEKIEVFENGS
ncbi:MAG TPA: recombinase family protein, partial [Clostridiales bacterium]|nr:recombinase family protein [Clostridiales bacterium]